MSRPRIVSLLPDRNAAGDLPAHLESVARFADAVVAPDDGSTDDTRAILEAHPLVQTVLTNPRREGYAGWDDAANRGRLLDAAVALGAQWVVQLFRRGYGAFRAADCLTTHHSPCRTPGRLVRHHSGAGASGGSSPSTWPRGDSTGGP